MPEDFVIARNPDGGSSLPYLLRVPLAPRPVLLKAKETWPRTGKVYCHRAEEWPADAEVVERVAVRSCERRGASIDLVLDRSRENRSQLVMTYVRGREAIFWQTARTTKQARPRVSLPTARAGGVTALEVVVDSHERYAYGFAGQQVVLRRAALPAGDYAVLDGDDVVASVERKSLADLTSSVTSGTLRSQLSGLAALPHAAVVVEDRWSSVFRLERVRPAVVADGLAECQVRYPSVPIVFCETRKLAQQWVYRFLAAAAVAHEQLIGMDGRLDGLVEAPPLAPRPAVRRTTTARAGGPSPAEVRAWALAQGYPVAERGRIRGEVVDAYLAARG